MQKGENGSEKRNGGEDHGGASGIEGKERVKRDKRCIKEDGHDVHMGGQKAYWRSLVLV